MNKNFEEHNDLELLEDDFEERFFFLEKDIVDECEFDFSDVIKKRGADYYFSGNVIECLKSDSQYYAKVKGSCDNFYEVDVEISEFGVEYSCSCPYDFPCKHEFATLIAISKQDYKKINLKPHVFKKEYDLKEILKQVPVEDIKNFLLSQDLINSNIFNEEIFEKYFFKYLPNQDYDYYYNNLYNSLMLNNGVMFLLDNYLNNVHKYITNCIFEEGFKIIKVIIESYHDSGKLNSDSSIIDIFPKLGMFLRVIYRKGSVELKDDINIWFLHLKSSKYYDNFYLEDMVLNLN